MINIVKDVLVDAFFDNIKIIPFLFFTFLLMEYIEESMQEKTAKALKKAGKIGPLLGSVVGVIPQCGLAAAASNLFAGRVISMGTLIAIFLSASDEMLPIMISEAVSPVLIITVLGTKIIIGMIAGFVIDFVITKILKQKEKEVDIHHFCEHENCDCEQGILKAATKHTIRIFAFLFVISLILGIVIEIFGLETVSGSVLANPYVGPVLCGIIGLIPNCAASVVITKLYLENAIAFGTMLSGLLAGAGVGILVLARVNEDKKENAVIIGLLFVIGTVSGLILNLFV